MMTLNAKIQIQCLVSGMTKLLVATGIGLEGRYLRSVEVINLDESNPDLICDNLPS